MICLAKVRYISNTIEMVTSMKYLIENDLDKLACQNIQSINVRVSVEHYYLLVNMSELFHDFLICLCVSNIH